MASGLQENSPRAESRLALLIFPTLESGILLLMDYQEPEMRVTGEIPEESDVILPMDPVRLDESFRENDVLDPQDQQAKRCAICSASSRKRLADHSFLPINGEVRKIDVEINWMATILELTSINRVPTKAESPKKLLLRDVLLGEIKDKLPWWHGFQLESLSGAWTSEDFQRFQGHPPTESPVLSWSGSGVWPITVHSQGQRG